MKIAIATDAWYPQISGVVTTQTHTIRELKRLGHEVSVIHPGRYRQTVPCPTYPQIRLALSPRQTSPRHGGADRLGLLVPLSLPTAQIYHCLYDPI